MRILGIETSCDETAACLLEADDNSFNVLSNVVASQIEIHRKYGGVVPEVAARKQLEMIIPVIEECLNPLTKTQWVFPGGVTILPDAIAVTQGPGLITSLRVGVQVAKTLSCVWNKPLVAVNHIEGHILSALLPQPTETQNSELRTQNYEFPSLALIVSGGHTELIIIKDYGAYELVGRTRDDAAGEAFDKVAKLLGLPYPGGPEISRLAEKGDATAFDFPRPMIDSDEFDFSFSGLKTAVLYTLRDLVHPRTPPSPPLIKGRTSSVPSLLRRGLGRSRKLPQNIVKNLPASFQQAVIDTLVTKTMRAAERFKARSIVLGGGVAANQLLRETLQKKCRELSVVCCMSPLAYTSDNAAMIAVAGYFKAQRGEYADWKTLVADPNLRLV